jgi:hypothetical protein
MLYHDACLQASVVTARVAYVVSLQELQQPRASYGSSEHDARNVNSKTRSVIVLEQTIGHGSLTGHRYREHARG